MEKYFSIINCRTFVALGITGVATYFTLLMDFTYNYDPTFVSIAIVFLLVFTIRSAFKRREKALEFLSFFRSGLITMDHSFQRIKKLSPEDKAYVRSLIVRIPKLLIGFLTSQSVTLEEVRDEAEKVNSFIIDKSEFINSSSRLKLNRIFRDVHMGIENSMSVKAHNTPSSMRAYCLIFIYIYPIIYTPSVYLKLQEGAFTDSAWLLYFLSMFSTFILISLYNVQEQLENPYDQKGLDDIHLTHFDLIRKSAY